MIVFPRILRLPEMEGHMKSIASGRAETIFKILELFTIRALAVSLLILACPLVNRAATDPTKSLTCSEMEEFLRLGKIGQQKNIPKGVTLPRRATLEYKGAQHDAVIQTVNVAKTSFQSTKGTELNFKDFWGYNVAGYELAKILELNMVPPYVERKVGGQEASLSWLVNDSVMELDRKNRHMEPPDLDSWNKQMYAVRKAKSLERFTWSRKTSPPSWSRRSTRRTGDLQQRHQKGRTGIAACPCQPRETNQRVNEHLLRFRQDLYSRDSPVVFSPRIVTGNGGAGRNPKQRSDRRRFRMRGVGHQVAA